MNVAIAQVFWRRALGTFALSFLYALAAAAAGAIMLRVGKKDPAQNEQIKELFVRKLPVRGSP